MSEESAPRYPAGMSRKWIDWAFAKRTGFPHLKQTLLALAWAADEEGRGAVAWGILRRDTEMDLPQLRPAIEALENFGFIYASMTETAVSFRLREG